MRPKDQLEFFDAALNPPLYCYTGGKLNIFIPLSACLLSALCGAAKSGKHEPRFLANMHQYMAGELEISAF